MSSEPFHTLGGFSTGIPEIAVVDANGNVVSNFNNLSGNVSANKVYANSYYYANGVPFRTGGSNTQLQYNNNGQFGGIPTATYSGNILLLGSTDDVSITGGINGYFLQTDGAGGLTWAPGGNGTSGNGTPGGANTQVQFNDEGDFGGASGFTFDKDDATLSSPNIVTNTITAGNFIGNGSQLTNISISTANFVSQPNQSNITSVGTLTGLQVSGNTVLGSVGNITITGGLNGYVLSTDGTGNLSWQAAGGGGGTPAGANSQFQFNDNGVFGGTAGMTYNKLSNAVTMSGNLVTRTLTANNTSIFGNANVQGNVTATFFNGNGAFLTGIVPDTANYVVQPNQSNITSVGTLNSLQVNGNIISSQFVSAASLQTSGNANVGILRTSGAATINGVLYANGNAIFSGANVNLGEVSNLRISGGLNGYVLTTDGLGTVSWQPGGGSGGGGNPGGSNTQVQYNDSGNFNGSAFFTFNEITNTVQVAGTLIANTMQLGSGAYKFGTSDVHFANTSSTSKQVLYSIPVSECSGADFEIIGTDSVGQRRQSVKISSIYYAGIVQYNEYAGLYVNGGVGNFEAEYNPGDVINPPSLDLAVTPDSANPTVYKMLITILNQ